MLESAVSVRLTAQRNAALPVEQGGLGLPPDNTAMDRARAMGFDLDLPLYHGTADDFPAFSLAKSRKVWQIANQHGTSFAAGPSLGYSAP